MGAVMSVIGALFAYDFGKMIDDSEETM